MEYSDCVKAFDAYASSGKQTDELINFYNWIDVVLNDESKRETPAIVCFGDKQRFIGTAEAASTMMNPKSSISQMKRLIGPDGYPLIHARYLGEPRVFTATHVFATMLGNLKEIAQKNLNAAVVDCCIGIPIYFTNLQRRVVLDAATIAGLHPLHLIHERIATALAYGIYKTDLLENDQLNVAFVDVGHASMQVCIAGFKKGQLKVLAHSYNRSLGGNFDEALFHHFAAKLYFTLLFTPLYLISFSTVKNMGSKLLWHMETRSCSVMQAFRYYLFKCF
ncbi:heat shock 70 kDa protein 15-like [Vicia villosa]|uniref:heat shock 70 kDa protein 15-like n=1 Tax=Vicia villosa TaxID=3911 RepID=UPI00273AF09F|nr:heat shock 70 kDa protein 15-like [Vicia villosa]